MQQKKKEVLRLLGRENKDSNKEIFLVKHNECGKHKAEAGIYYWGRVVCFEKTKGECYEVFERIKESPAEYGINVNASMSQQDLETAFWKKALKICPPKWQACYVRLIQCILCGNLYDYTITNWKSHVEKQHLNYFKNHASEFEKTLFLKHCKSYAMIDLMDDNDKNEMQQKVRADVISFLEVMPNVVDKQIISELDRTPQDASYIPDGIKDAIQAFLVKHTTALMITPNALQHASMQTLVTV